MSFKKTLIFAIILAGIIGFYYYFEVIRAPKIEKEEEEAKKVFHFETEDVNKLTVSSNEESVVCQLKDKNWRIIEPIRTEVDKTTVEGLIQSLHNVDFSRVVEENAKDLQKYGLAIPLVTISVSAKGKNYTFIVGDENPTGSGAYAKVAGETRILLIDSYMRNSLNKKLFDLRGKSVITFELEEVKQFSLLKDDLNVEALRQGDKDWVLKTPINSKGDKDKIEEVLNKFRNARAKEFVDEKPESLKPYGLDNPQAKLTVWLGNEKALKALLIGKKDEEKKGYYAKLKEAEGMFLVEETLLADIPSDIFDWRDKSLLSFERDDVHRILIRFAGEATEIKRKKKDAWRMIKPLKVDADRWEISSLLSDIEYAKSTAFIDPPLKQDSYYGFDTPALELSLWLKGSKHPLSITVGEKKGEDEEYFVRSTQNQSIALVKAEALEKLKKSSFDLRNKEILGYQHDELEQIVLKFPEQEVIIGKSRDKWRVLKPRKLKKKKKEAEDLIWSLNSVQMKNIVAESAPDLKPYGLGKPKVEVEVKLKKGKSPQMLLIGKKVEDAEELYAKLKSQPAIYRINASIWNDIEKLIKEEEEKK